MTPAPGYIVAGKYQLVRPLAAGGMGSVWVARHVALDTDVAVKFIATTNADESSIRRFEREAQASAKLRGRHLVHTFDFGFDDGQPFLVMELLEGENLSSWIARAAPLAPALALELLEELAKGLRLVHAAGIVHRDIKPSNLFLAREGDETVLKLLDFGIAKGSHHDSNTTSQGTLLGSPGYMSPEQARGAVVDARSDLWSTAVVLFELLTGHELFKSAHSGDAIARICSDPIPAASSLVPELGPSVDRFFQRALARNPRARFASIDELALAFHLALETPSSAGDPHTAPSTPVARGRDSLTEPMTREEGATETNSTAPAPPDEITPRGSGKATLFLLVALALAAGFFLRGPLDSDRSLLGTTASSNHLGLSLENLAMPSENTDNPGGGASLPESSEPEPPTIGATVPFVPDLEPTFSRGASSASAGTTRKTLSPRPHPQRRSMQPPARPAAAKPRATRVPPTAPEPSDRQPYYDPFTGLPLPEPSQ